MRSRAGAAVRSPRPGVRSPRPGVRRDGMDEGEEILASAPQVSWWDMSVGEQPAGDEQWRRNMAEAEHTIDERYRKLESAEERHRERKRAVQRAKEEEARAAELLANREKAQRAAASRALQLRQDPGALSSLSQLKPDGGGGAAMLMRKRPTGGAWAKVRAAAGTDGSSAEGKKLRLSMVDRLRVAQREANVGRLPPVAPAHPNAAPAATPSSPRASPSRAKTPRTPASRVQTPTWDDFNESLEDGDDDDESKERAASRRAAKLRGELTARPRRKMAGSVSLPELPARASATAAPSAATAGASSENAASDMWSQAIRHVRQKLKPAVLAQTSPSNPLLGASPSTQGQRTRTRVGVVKDMQLPSKSAAEVRGELALAWLDVRARGLPPDEGGGGSAEQVAALQKLANLPPSMQKLPPHTLAASEEFCRRHTKRVAQACSLVAELNIDPTHKSSKVRVGPAVGEVFRTRLVLPGGLDELSGRSTKDQQAKRRTRKNKEEELPFDLYKSVWAARAAWNDSGDIYDTDEVEMQRFANDWAVICSELKMGKFIMRNDDQGRSDADGDGTPDEIQEVQAVLWEFHDLIFVLFMCTCRSPSVALSASFPMLTLS